MAKMPCSRFIMHREFLELKNRRIKNEMITVIWFVQFEDKCLKLLF